MHVYVCVYIYAYVFVCVCVCICMWLVGGVVADVMMTTTTAESNPIQQIPT